MKTLYQAANLIEAQLLADLLEQEGFFPSVLGAHLQGAIGEVPVSGLIRIDVNEDDYQGARSVVARWQAGAFSLTDDEPLQDLSP